MTFGRHNSRVDEAVSKGQNEGAKGISEPTFGKLDVSAEDAKTHNRLLSQAEIDGLDQNCTVGLGGMFYTKKAEGRTIVATWLGQEVCREVQVRGAVLVFTRKGMKFQGRLRPEDDYFSRVGLK